MKKVLLFARDPGAANVVAPLMEPLKKHGYQPRLFGKDAALQQYRRLGQEGIDINEVAPQMGVAEYRRFLRAELPSFMITGTGSDDFAEKYLWKAADSLGIPSFAILDHWFNYGIRFSPYRLVELAEYDRDRRHTYLPTRILVMDESVKTDMMRDGFDPALLLVVGQPYFDFFRAQAKTFGTDQIEAYRRRLELAPGEKLVAFFSENITEPDKGDDLPRYYWGYTERSVFRELLAALGDTTMVVEAKVCVVVKPHPNETIDAYSDLIAQGLQGLHVRVLVDRAVHTTQLCKAADLVCGMSSMVLIESSILGLPILSIQIGLTREDPFVLSKKGVTRSVLSGEELRERLKDFLLGQGGDPVSFGVPEGAAERIIRLMEGFR